MGVIGTFGSFASARMGIYASQASLNVTGNNIANINTKGYTRQHMDLVSLHSGGSDRYSNQFSINIGYGVLCEGVGQSRDPYLDIRFRNENSSVGAMEAKLNGLNELSNILDEVGMGSDGEGVIEAQFNTIYEQLEILSRNVGSEEYDTLVRSSATALCQLFNTYAKELDTVKENQVAKLEQNVDRVNEILTSIRDLNEQIRNAGIHGDRALELRDTRNVLIDELSSFMKIDVKYGKEYLDQYSDPIEKLEISLADTDIKLVDGIYVTQFDMPEEVAVANPDYAPESIDEGKKYMHEAGDGTITYYSEEQVIRNVDDTTGEMTYHVTVNGSDVEVEVNPGYAKLAYRYLDKDGNPVEAMEGAATTFNYSKEDPTAEGSQYLLHISALTNAKGKVLKENGVESLDQMLEDTTLYGALQANRELLTEKGEFATEADLANDKNANVKRGIPYYEKALDALAKKFADTMNEANSLPAQTIYKNKISGPDVDNGNNASTITFLGNDDQPITDKDGNNISIVTTTNADGTTTTSELTTAQLDVLREKGALKPEYSTYNGGNLFSNKGDGNDGSNITAENISVSKAWATGAVRILNTKEPDTLGVGNSTAKDNINHMITLMTTKLEYRADDVAPDAADGEVYFKGTYQEFFAGITDTLASDSNTTLTLYNSYDAAALALDNDRSSVSGVDLNEEATNMMQFQKSYSAACRLLTTIDSMLDKLINGTAV